MELFEGRDWVIEEEGRGGDSGDEHDGHESDEKVFERVAERARGRRFGWVRCEVTLLFEHI